VNQLPEQNETPMKTYVTEIQQPDGLYGYEVDAVDWEHAQSICDERRPGEKVVGELRLTISAEHTTPEKVTEMMKALADEEAQFGERP
jgi:hypothetical protein